MIKESSVKIPVVIIILVVLAMGGAACSGEATTVPAVTPTATEQRISECEAIAIARLELPEEYRGATTSSGLRGDDYFINFKTIEVTPEEIGWQEDDITHFYHENDKPWGKDRPENLYRNSVVYIDAFTGEVTGCELNNEIILGPIPPDCP